MCIIGTGVDRSPEVVQALVSRTSERQQGSGYEQAKAELRRVEIDEVAVALGPLALVKIVAEAAHRPLLSLRPDPRPR